MKGNAATAAGLLVLLLIPVTFGCQIKGKMAEEGGGLVPKEQVSVNPKEQVRLSLNDNKERISYSIGLDMGRDLQRQELKVDVGPLIQGIKDGFRGNQPLLSDAEVEQVRRYFFAQQQTARAKALGPRAEKNLADGEAFLRENAKKEGVKTLPSGLQYRVLQSGTGSTPAPDQNVKARYIVRSIDGTELDNSYKIENPSVFPVGGVMPAWTEALQLMKEGDKWELFAPSHLAYGEKGAGSAVGPFQALVFELELLGIH